MTSSPFPLDGVRVVAFEQAVAAPLATRHLADLGADVIKVERRGEGDFARGYDSAVGGTSTWFAWLSRRKRSLTLDVKLPGGREVAQRLIERADVVVQNFAPGAFDRLELGVEQLHARYPRLIAASITGYGEDGPYRDRKAYDLLLQAEAGVISVSGTPEAAAKTGISVADISGGMYAFSSILAALYRRERTGEGAAIRISLFDSIMEWMSPLSLMATHGPHPKRAGARHASIVPYGPYGVAGGRQVVLAVQNEREWQRFCAEVLESPEIATDPRFNSNELRLANRVSLETLIEDVLSKLSVEDAELRLEAASLAYSRMNDVEEVLNHPQVLERDRLLDVALPGGAAAQVLRAPFNIEGAEEADSTVPAVGEHTDAILAELGYNEPDIARLRSDGAV
ncbi:MAG TPA: CaiB/BaiF CoA-transferase family protein [Dehalococcoidia bacterium]|nr:CaiB/BaiF CoA-transferase family protein [Dehalococcoidia bacterium]